MNLFFFFIIHAHKTEHNENKEDMELDESAVKPKKKGKKQTGTTKKDKYTHTKKNMTTQYILYSYIIRRED